MKTNQRVAVFVAGVGLLIGVNLIGIFWLDKKDEAKIFENKMETLRLRTIAAKAESIRIGSLRAELRALIEEHGNLEVWADCPFTEATSIIYNPELQRFEMRR